MAIPQSGNGSGEQPGFGARVDHIGATAQETIDEAKAVLGDLRDRIDIHGRLERHPYATLAAAAGIGYLLGGGLFTSLTARVLRLGIRFAALPLVKDELLGMAEAAVNDLTGSKPPSRGGSGTTGEA